MVPRRHGLTLLETLLATAVLVVVVTAVMSALSAGRAQSEHAQQAIAASLSAEMLMARITGVNDADFATALAWRSHFTDDISQGGWNGHLEQPGSLRAGREATLPLLPPTYQQCQLQVSTERRTQFIAPPIATAIDGVEVTVEARSPSDASITRIVRFIPVPHTLVEAGP